ncbi:sulfotransferase 1C3-like [Cydia strobilella]|uniref:sulfotransferase 1C3-like n=1 Tax=Cydia strobilella TaxID=1100964 RepID=UPI0030046C43
MEVRPDDVWLVTYPRSGTTMTCEILWLMMNNLDYEKAAKTHMFHRRHFLEFFTFLHEQTQDLDTYPSLHDFPVGYRLAASSPSPRLVVTHLPLSLLPPKVLDVARVVFVARDPRDVAVSWYHLLRMYRCFDFVGDFKEFWKLFMEDSILFTPFFPRLKETWALRNHSKMLFLFYEDMIKDIPRTLKKISSFCGKQYSQEQLLTLADHLSIDNFRQNQSVQSVLETIPGMKNEGGEGFIRKGKSGGWRDYFDEEMRLQAEIWFQRSLAGTDITFAS